MCWMEYTCEQRRLYKSRLGELKSSEIFCIVSGVSVVDSVIKSENRSIAVGGVGGGKSKTVSLFVHQEFYNKKRCGNKLLKCDSM